MIKWIHTKHLNILNLHIDQKNITSKTLLYIKCSLTLKLLYLHTHTPYLCWIYNEDTQQDFKGIHICAIVMLNALPTNKHEILLIAHNADYDCRFILQYLQKKLQHWTS